jgi:hypothetical protein
MGSGGHSSELLVPEVTWIALPDERTSTSARIAFRLLSVPTSNRQNVIHDIPNLGFAGDQLLRPLFMDDEWRPYEGRGDLCGPVRAR